MQKGKWKKVRKGNLPGKMRAELGGASIHGVLQKSPVRAKGSCDARGRKVKGEKTIGRGERSKTEELYKRDRI